MESSHHLRFYPTKSNHLFRYFNEKYPPVIILFSLAYVSELIANALAECNNHRLSAAFLIERQAALEGAHVFQPYVTWFEVSYFKRAAY